MFDRCFLRELEQLAPPAGRAAFRLARESSGQRIRSTERQGGGNPSGLFAWSAPDSILDAPRAALGTRPSARARAIIDTFERTAQIHRLFLSGRVYESNVMRSAFLRENFTKALAAAERRGERPRVLFKFGGNHMMRGWKYTHTLGIGTAATILADAHDERAFNLLIMGVGHKLGAHEHR